MSNFVKLYGSILYSTVWLEPLPTKVVWITMLALADADGVVAAAIPGLAKMAGVTRNECEIAIETLLAPDADSKTIEHEGRRIEAVEGGWLILNHRKYREMRTETQIATAERVRKHRQEKKGADVTVTNVTKVTRRNGVKPPETPVTPEEEEEEEAEADKKRTTKATKQPSPFPKSICDALYETWVSVRGPIDYGALRKALSPLYPAVGPRFTQEQLTLAIKAHAEWVEGLSPREAGFENVHKFAADIQRWVRIGGMPVVDPDTRELTERGRLALA